MNTISTCTLNNNTRIPVLGLGVFKSPSGKVTQNAVLAALRNGYRHIDTAKIYANEEDVGTAVRKSGLQRGDVFITTKLWNADQGYAGTKKAFEESLNKLQTEYIDLYLMHWPVAGLRSESWKAMEEIYASGKVKAIGVSNFMKRHLEELLGACKVVPAVNQIELSPYNYLYRKDTVDFCVENDICVEAYSPLTKGVKLKDPELVSIAEGYGISPAQLLIRWGLEHHFVVIPKSVSEQRIIENGSVFNVRLSDDDLMTLDHFNVNLVTGWDPTDAP